MERTDLARSFLAPRNTISEVSKVGSRMMSKRIHQPAGRLVMQFLYQVADADPHTGRGPVLVSLGESLLLQFGPGQQVVQVGAESL